MEVNKASHGGGCLDGQSGIGRRACSYPLFCDGGGSLVADDGHTQRKKGFPTSCSGMAHALFAVDDERL
jgi:hypothetical protein